jgi:hypothetical protein
MSPAKGEAKGEKMDEVIKLLLSAGYMADGVTLSESYKVITANSYPLAGSIVTTGGRKRFSLPNTNKRVTVGKRVVCFYEKEGVEVKNFRNIKTADLESIKKEMNQ